ncbi:hypothetical protein [Gordonia sp. NPDC003376]
MTVTDVDLLGDLKQMIIDGSAGEERSQQRDLGPSEVGTPCLRKLALKLYGAPHTSRGSDPLPSVVGTGAHAMVQAYAEADNARRIAHGDGMRWMAEQRVTVRQGLAGTCDLLDLQTFTVIDWKFPGQSRFDHYKRHGPSEVYRRQAHLYGRGWCNRGIPVQRVGICFLPRGGQLKHAHLWTEPFDDAVVDETLARLDLATALIWDLDIDNHPENVDKIPATTGDCYVCPFHASTPLTPFECNGI